MIFQGRRVRFTNHALDRLKESQLDLLGGLKLISEAVEETEIKKYKDLVLNKSVKYKQQPATYFRNGSHIFTAIKAIDNIHQDEIWLILTVTNQLATSKSVSKYWNL